MRIELSRDGVWKNDKGTAHAAHPRSLLSGVDQRSIAVYNKTKDQVLLNAFRFNSLIESWSGNNDSSMLSLIDVKPVFLIIFFCRCINYTYITY